MLASRSHRREAERILQACRSAGAEGRFFPALCASAPVRRLVEAHAREQGNLAIELARATAETPVPEPLRAHRGDHYNRTLFGVDLDSPAALKVWESLRDDIIGPGTWVILWLPTPSAQQALRAHAPELWNLRHFDASFYSAELIAGSGVTPSAGGAQLFEAGHTQDALSALAMALKAGEPGAQAQLATVLWSLGETASADALLAARASDPISELHQSVAIRRRRRDLGQGISGDEQLPPLEAFDDLESLFLLAEAYALAENNDGALGTYRHACEQLPQSEHAQALLGGARWLIGSGRLDEASEWLTQAQDTGEAPLETLREKGRLAARRAAEQTAEGDGAAAETFDLARQILADAFNMARTVGRKEVQLKVAMDLADLNGRAGLFDAAITSLQLAGDFATELDHPNDRFDIARARHRVQAHTGNHTGALGALAEMEALAQQTGLPRHEAAAAEALGDHNIALQIPEPARQRWAHAEELYRWIGLSGPEQRCKEKIRSLESS